MPRGCLNGAPCWPRPPSALPKYPGVWGSAPVPLDPARNLPHTAPMVPLDKLAQITQRFEYLEARLNAGASPSEIAEL